MKKILIISQDFPPLNTIASRRFGELSNYLEEFGWKPWILTMKSEGPLKRLLPPERIIEVGEHARKPGKGWYSDRRSIAVLTRLGLLSRLLEPKFFRWCSSVLQAKSEILDRTQGVDLILATYRPLSSLWLASRLAQDFRIPWWADFRDLGAFRKDERIFPISQIDRWAEKIVLRSAAGIVTVSPTWKEMLSRIFKKSAVVVHNGFDPQIEDLELPNFENAQIKFPENYLYYAGQLYPHQMSSIALLFQSLMSRPEVYFVFRLLGPHSLIKKTEALAKIYGIERRLQILPPGSPAEVHCEAEGARANLVFQHLDTDDEWTRGIITGKLLRLLPLKPPILVIAGEKSDIGPLLSHTQRGRMVSSSDQILEFIDSASIYRGDSEAVKEYSKRNQARHLALSLESSLKP